MPAFQSLDKALRWLRIQRRRKQGEVARQAGITQAMLCSYEQGKRLPTLSSLEKILDSLEVDLVELAAALTAVRAGVEPVPSSGRPEPRFAAPRGGARPRLDLYRVLGVDGPLPEAEERAMAQMLDGFCRWLRVLHQARRLAAPTAAGSPPAGGGGA